MLSWHQKPTYTSTLFQTLHVLASKTFCLLGSLCLLPSCFLFVLPHPGVSWVKITTSSTVLHAEICLPPVHYSVTAICCLTPSLGLLFFCGFFFFKALFCETQSLEWKGFIKVIIIPRLSAVNYLSHPLSLKWSKASYLLCSSSLPAVPLSSVSRQHLLCSLPFIFCATYRYCSPWSRGSQWGVAQTIF